MGVSSRAESRDWWVKVWAPANTVWQTWHFKPISDKTYHLHPSNTNIQMPRNWAQNTQEALPLVKEVLQLHLEWPQYFPQRLCIVSFLSFISKAAQIRDLKPVNLYEPFANWKYLLQAVFGETNSRHVAIFYLCSLTRLSCLQTDAVCPIFLMKWCTVWASTFW